MILTLETSVLSFFAENKTTDLLIVRRSLRRLFQAEGALWRKLKANWDMAFWGNWWRLFPKWL